MNKLFGYFQFGNIFGAFVVFELRSRHQIESSQPLRDRLHLLDRFHCSSGYLNST